MIDTLDSLGKPRNWTIISWPSMISEEPSPIIISGSAGLGIGVFVGVLVGLGV